MVDMNLSRDWVELLDEAGHGAVHWSDVGRDDDDDREIIAWAAAHDHAVLTADLDFGEMLTRSGRDRPSVVQIRRRDTRASRIGASVVTEIRNAEAYLEIGSLLTIGSRSVRVRRLSPGS